ncbi:MAG TPA: hypothetical protein VGW78_04885 [Candidatus Babeliales bacterium]|jgi:hypothetical protein|nr:hypothetical protein [Candidatus Babeliales bacterium]
MIAKKGALLAFILVMQSGSALSAPRKNFNLDKELHQVALTDDQAEWVVQEIENILQQARIYDHANKAPRPDAAQPCDGVFPACNTFDLTELAACCCTIRNILCCIGTSIFEVLGNCLDKSILLPSVVDKSDIDAICASTITLLKTILLELRGAFVTL